VITAYSWKLNSELIYADNLDPVKSMQIHEFPRTVFTFELSKQITDGYPYRDYRLAAVETENFAIVAAQKQEWIESYGLFQRCASLMERFRHPAIIATAREWYLRSAETALAGAEAGLCLLSLRQYFSIGDATSEAVNLKRKAKDLDTKMLGQIEDLLRAPSMDYDEVEWAIKYLNGYPLPTRLALAEQVVERFRNQSTNRCKLLSMLASCYMAQGRWNDVTGLFAQEDSGDPSIREQFFQWQHLMEPVSEGKGTAFGAIPDNCNLDVTDAVNRGLTYLVNGFYNDALEWFLFALAKTPTDPFALFGHGLYLWRIGCFALAAERLELAKSGIENYPTEFRFVSFSRFDDTCPPRSYDVDSNYPIFNPRECLDQVKRLQPFVSYVLIP
jgi:tetratricopeptide (TPR) repeat protein